MNTFYVGIADTTWFSLLRDDDKNGMLGEYVNFWTPGTKEFKALKPGELFLFKLHKRQSTGENGEIVGGAFFSHFERLSMADAWEKYGRGNGRESLQSMEDSLKAMRKRNNLQGSTDIGCIILENAFFLDKWIDEPTDWNKNIVSGKKYTFDEPMDKELNKTVWNAIDKKAVQDIENEIGDLPVQGQEREVLVKARVNQSVFRDKLLKRYQCCCLCGIGNPSLLIASHIKPWSKSAANEKLDVENGFLLCPNHDALFDGGYISFEDDGQILISDKLSEEDRKLFNIVLEKKIALTDANKRYLSYHREKIFSNKKD